MAVIEGFVISLLVNSNVFHLFVNGVDCGVLYGLLLLVLFDDALGDDGASSSDAAAA